ncbi:hydrolase, alpha/beta domain family protein [Actinomyces urogenitalis DSM 15434]|uniref:Hydrolase, alpha/beta domain family protein n=1 Tax=Actinomyces urogenitalis DSM 15434 TaxID=525246 RepID=C0W816_9ACTO|nr:alpha/beta hydrolase [Actinomyces urogenitalis]EEH65138.1 hydrolase, alpha/beta domain family protein [Actinomyces urogenitalis DSM 15434]MBS6072174.1 alpha/beta fold hydrolase [Actinomyces urogenitalis]MDK8237740.1 alpha/beta hydrolase [Actinomyces urogenitalis]MDK8835558.1 alpha/beta hydrolase [Actinomyces urogenitalis]MDU0863678.1 alpha/beta hydrolase [Actinomyces urogenitalis]
MPRHHTPSHSLASQDSQATRRIQERVGRNYLDFDEPPAPDAHVLVRAVGDRRVRAWDVAQLDGEGGPVFVLLHGLGAGALLFQEVIEELRRYGRVLVVDLPGFSNLPRPRRPMTMEDFAASVEALVERIDLSEELDVDNPVLIGHSMGTQVALELARRAPRLAGRLVLIAPVMGPGTQRLDHAALAFARSSLHERPTGALVSISGFLHAGLVWPARTLPFVLRYPFAERVSAIGGHLEIVRGTHDLLCPQAWAEELLERSGATGSVRVAEGASHQVILDHAHTVVEAALSAAGSVPNRADRPE